MQVLAWSLAVGSVDDLLTLMDANATAKGLVENVRGRGRRLAPTAWVP